MEVLKFHPVRRRPLLASPLYFPFLHTAMGKHIVPGGGGGGGGLTFLGQTDQSAKPRPYLKSAMNPVPFTDKASLTNAINGMVGGDYIFYNGPSPGFTISASGADAYSILNKNPSSPVVIDFGTATTKWGTSLGNHVTFNYTGAGKNNSLYINSCSNLKIYGGEYVGGGLVMQAPSHYNEMWDIAVHNIGGTGLHFRGNTSGGASSEADHCFFRMEVFRMCLNPQVTDPHADKGTGIHGFLFHDTSGGNVHDNTVIVDGYNPLQPGEVSPYDGLVYPEGAMGSICEIGSPGASENNNTFYLRGTNCHMIPNATNPGSSGSGQTGGNVINAWGNVKFNGMVVAWLEGNDMTGQLLSAAGGSYWPGSPAATILHGRWHNINQSTAGGNAPEPYATVTKTGATLGFIYQDMLAY